MILRLKVRMSSSASLKVAKVAGETYILSLLQIRHHATLMKESLVKSEN